MKHFTAVVRPIGRFALQLTFPDLPGCSSTAYSWDGLDVVARKALDIFLQERPFIVPAPFTQVRDRPEVQRALSEGAQLLLIKHVSTVTRH